MKGLKFLAAVSITISLLGCDKEEIIVGEFDCTGTQQYVAECEKKILQTVPNGKW